MNSDLQEIKKRLNNVLENTKNFKQMSATDLVFKMDVSRRILEGIVTAIDQIERKEEPHEVLKPKTE